MEPFALEIFSDIVIYICAIVSIPFLVATILVYIYIPELHNLHGTCLVCYLVCLVSSTILMNPYIVPPKYGCVVGSYLGLCAVHWLQVIGYDMWTNLTSLRSVAPKSFQMKRFLLYALYACFAPLLSFIGLAFLIVALTSLELWEGYVVVTIVYLCLTLPIIIAFFVITASKVNRVQQEIQEITLYEEHYRHRNNLKIQEETFTTYIRFFIAMAVHVCISNALYILSRGSMYANLVNVCLSLEGVWIFGLLVLKRNILCSIKKRLRSMRIIFPKKDSTANPTNLSIC